MKKIYSLLAMGAITLGAGAAVNMPLYMAQDFKDAFNQGALPEGWSTIGQDAKPSGNLAAEFFPDYSATNAYSLLSTGTDVIAFSPSVFEGGVQSNEWLISPAFEVTDPESILTFTVGAYGNNITNNFKVYVSEGGTAKEDFTEMMSSGAKGSQNGVNLAYRRYVISEYYGKTIRLAFVNEGNTSGMLGFTDIQTAPYYLKIDNMQSYQTLVLSGDNNKVGMTVTMTPPVACTGFTAKLTTSTGFETSFVSKSKFTSTKAKKETFEFPDEIDLGSSESADYTITITPNYDGAPATEVTGRILFAEMIYNKVALLEEFTGTWCGWCPYGYSLLNYLCDKYDGKDGNPLAIGVAIHNGDPMAVSSIDNAMSTIARPLGFGGYPCLLINREQCEHPASSLDYIENLLTEKTYAQAKVNNVTYDVDTREVTFKYELSLGYDTDYCGLKALVITTQNNMSGKSSNWTQSNNLNGYTAEQIASDFGEDAVPYFEMFLGKGQSVKGLMFNDVALNYYPSVSGEEIIGSFVKNEPTELTVKFTMVDELMSELNSKITVDPENVSLAVVILDSSGNIVAGDHVEYADFTLTDVKGVEACNIAVASSNGMVSVKTPAAGVVRIFTADGCMVAEQKVAEGVSNITAPRGMAIVKVEAGMESKTAKVIVK